MRKNKVATVSSMCLARARAFERYRSILHGPALWSVVHAVATPSVKSLAVEEHDVAILILGEGCNIYIFLVSNLELIILVGSSCVG